MSRAANASASARTPASGAPAGPGRASAGSAPGAPAGSGGPGTAGAAGAGSTPGRDVAPGPPGAAASPERIVARLRRHGRALLIPALLFIAVSGATVYAITVFPDLWQRLAITAAGALVVVVCCLLPFLSWLARRTTVTTKRLILRSGVFVRTRQELLLGHGREVTVRQTPGQRIFGSGNVRIDTGHERFLVLRDLPKPALVQSALHELMPGPGPDATAGGRRPGDPPAPIDGDTVVWGRH